MFPVMSRHTAIAFQIIVGIFCILLGTSAAQAEQSDYNTWKHGDALFGDLKYGPGFEAYDHVNPNAPKGGRLNRTASGSYDSFNPFIVRGRPAAGLTYTGGVLWDTLMEQSIDQPSATYGLIAEAFKYPADYSSATYRLHPDARWHDGKPITPEDVIWSLEVLKANQPLFANYYRNVVSAEETGEREVTFRFDIRGNRELPKIMGDMPVLPKHWWTGTDANGNPRNIAEPTLEPPLGSGPYRIAEFDVGASVTLERVEDYWAADLGTRKGRFNFDEIHYVYFSDRNAMWEAFKKGGIEDIWRENVSRRWATGYNFPSFENGNVLRQTFPTGGPEIHQAFYLNTRLEKFQNPKLREALTLLFDFESLNETQFFNLYQRTDSYFEGGELQAQGLPEGRELAILKEYEGRIPHAVFEKPFTLPVYASDRDRRNYQRQALRLFREAGYTFKGGEMLDAEGEPFTIEFLGADQTSERITGRFIEDLRLLGIEASLRIVDQAQYQNRMDNYDFEIATVLSRQSLSPGNEQREYWSSDAADKPGGRNPAGIKNPVVDELVERIITAENREELVALTKALDRILLWHFYSIPHWYNPEEWYAWWRKIQIPEPQPEYTGFDLFSTWIDTDIERELGQ